VDLEVFYLGHVKKKLYTIQYNTMLSVAEVFWTEVFHTEYMYFNAHCYIPLMQE